MALAMIQISKFPNKIQFVVVHKRKDPDKIVPLLVWFWKLDNNQK